MSLGRRFAFNTSTACIPANLARRKRSEYTAGIVPLPGRPIPRASVKQFIVLAVYMPEQEPHVGHAVFSISDNSASSISPV